MSEDNCNYDQSGLASAWGAPALHGRTRSMPADFQVDEILGFELSGSGEHVWLQLRKTALNTQELLRRIAKLAAARERDIGLSGLKDRNAITSQWFSVAVPESGEPDWSQLNDDQVTVLQVVRHSRKLRRGTHKSNRFQLLIRDLKGHREDLPQRMALISSGVPNYFGEQRFGHGANNLAMALQMFRRQGRKPSRYQRGLYLSAARSMLFNQLLSRRVEASTWDSPLAGDVMMLEGSHSVFTTGPVDDELVRRCRDLDIHPSGPLWGQGALRSKHDALALEKQLQSSCSEWCRGLENAGLKQERRALRLLPGNFDWQADASELRLQFDLPAGAFATSVLRQCILPASQTRD